MGKILTAVLGGGVTPRVSPAAVDMTEEEKKKAKKSKAQVLATGGGIVGEELQSGSVGGDTLFNN